MKKPLSAIILGVFLVIFGGLLLLQNFDLVDFSWDIVMAILFGLGGLAFLSVFVLKPVQWWALIPGFTLLGLGSVITIDYYRPGSDLGGAVFLGAIGLSFCLIYLSHRVNWWALIPGGSLLTLALVAGVSSASHGNDEGWIFLFGMGLTFALVYIIPTPAGRMHWAAIPAGIFLVLGLITAADTVTVFKYIWPAAIILVGLVLLYRAYAPGSRAAGTRDEGTKQE